MAHESESGGKKKMSVGKIVLIVVGVLLVIGIFGGSGEPTGTPTDSSAPAATQQVAPEEKKEDPSIPAEYRSALKKAESYSKNMHMSKQGIYDQLTSEYGEQFSAEAAQYAMDNLQADYKENALKKAQSYQDNMAMSPEAIRDQLISEYGEQFTQEEADYAIANL